MATKHKSSPKAQGSPGPKAPAAGAALPSAAPPEASVRTVNGKPIPAEFAHLIHWAQTDQGIAELNVTRNRTGSGIRVNDKFDRQIEHRRDAGDGKVEAFTAPDPLKEAINRISEPGFRYKALSPRLIERRGLRGFEVCIDKNGDEVRMANMVIGRMPIELADTRNKHYRDLGNEALKASEEHYHTQQAKLIRDGGAVGVSTLGPGERLHGEDLGGKAHDVTVGLRSHRGNSHFTEDDAA